MAELENMMDKEQEFRAASRPTAKTSLVDSTLDGELFASGLAVCFHSRIG